MLVVGSIARAPRAQTFWSNEFIDRCFVGALVADPTLCFGSDFAISDQL